MKEKDKIEKSFDLRFDPNSIRNEGWNDPSDSVWANIEKEIYSDKKRRVGFLPFFLVALLLVSLLISTYLYQQNQELKSALNNTALQAQTKVLSHEPTIEVRSAKVSDITQPRQELIESESKKSAQKLNPKAEKRNVAVSNNLNHVASDETLKENNEKYLLEGNEKIANSSLGIDKIDDLEVAKLSVIQQRENIAISSIDSKIQTLKVEQFITIPKINKVVNSEVKSASKILIMPRIGVSMLSTTGVQETALSELIDKEYGDIGVGLDVVLSTPITNSIDLTMGVGVERMNFSTEYDITLNYSKDEEVIDGAHGYIDFEHSLPTAFGNTDTALRLSRIRNSANIDQPNVDIDFNTNHRFIALAIPLGIQYNIGLGGSNFKIGFSTRPTYILQGSSSIKSVFSHHSEIDAVNNISHSNYTDVSKFNIGIGVDLGYQIFLTEKSGLNINVGYQDYLFDFYKVNDFSSSLKQLGGSLGFIYSL